MSRLARKNRTDMGLKSSGGLNDLFDNAMKEYLRVNDVEFDFILDKACNMDDAGDASLMNLLVNESKTISEKRQLLTILDKFIKELYN